MSNLLEKIVSLAKRRGFIFPSSEIYGGVEGVWDYGPLGALMKENIKREWRKKFFQERKNEMSLMDGSVLMHLNVWRASGHLENFTDLLVECKKCHSRFREDKLVEKKCSNCGSEQFTTPRKFNLMFKTFLGPAEDTANVIYLRPETAQSMFTNFKLIQELEGFKLPFGIAQVGKSFRNEITTGNFTFRSREFEIAEIEYFVKPGTDERWFDYWLKEWQKFILSLGIKKKNIRLKEHSKRSLAHYSKRTVDIEYKFPFGWSELAGVANRTDYDLKRHSEFSGKDLRYFDIATGQRYFPYVIEPTLGIERLILALLLDAYEEIKGGRTKTTEAVKEIEIVLRLSKKVAPVQLAVFPLVRNNPSIVKKAKEIFNLLKTHFVTDYHSSGSIGRRYRRADEIGTPYCITVDFDSLKKRDVTIRDRDTMLQKRVRIKDLIQTLREKLEN